MSKTISKIIETLITECECDNRIETGVFDVYNAEHLVVLSEHMESHGIPDSVIENAIESMVDEGKYPERQAYNKDGWLVTFPSKEYKDRAIKKGTHFSSDPTHGKGGMNLYYKRKGKQKRQQSQRQTSTDTQAQQKQAAAPAQSVEKPTQPPPAETPARTPDEEANFQKLKNAQKFSRKDADDVANYIAGREKGYKPDTPQPSTGTGAEKSDSSPSRQHAADSTVDSTAIVQPTKDYAVLSKKFAAQKGWMPTPYGEYRDAQGNSVAVVGLSGEIVPIKNNDREEYKIFAEKNMPQQT